MRGGLIASMSERSRALAHGSAASNVSITTRTDAELILINDPCDAHRVAALPRTQPVYLSKRTRSCYPAVMGQMAENGVMRGVIYLCRQQARRYACRRLCGDASGARW